jgi:hypothetical protein
MKPVCVITGSPHMGDYKKIIEVNALGTININE